uniref:Fc alpha receptor n=1 Tax=Nomascus leucogenys TaxID=61853 RepID=A0A2I3H4T4_NOMLE
MDPKETTLLCLGDSPMPFISAKSSPVIPLGGSVKIECQAIREAYLTQLMILKNSTYQEIGRRLKFWNETNPDFIVNHMDANKAGRYQCQYRIGHYRFRYSDTLELVVTGLYGKPFLSADRGLVLMPGENISLTCSSAHIPFDRFSLAKEGELSLPRHQSGEHPANFSLGPVGLNVSGIYRCYGWHHRSPYLWSFPSNALELAVTGRYRPVQPCVWVGCPGHKALNKEASADVAETSWNQQMCQPGLTFARTPSVCK